MSGISYSWYDVYGLYSGIFTWICKTMFCWKKTMCKIRNMKTMRKQVRNERDYGERPFCRHINIILPLKVRTCKWSWYFVLGNTVHVTFDTSIVINQICSYPDRYIGFFFFTKWKLENHLMIATTFRVPNMLVVYRKCILRQYTWTFFVFRMEVKSTYNAVSLVSKHYNCA
jgi:hypothetical protein